MREKWTRTQELLVWICSGSGAPLGVSRGMQLPGKNYNNSLQCSKKERKRTVRGEAGEDGFPISECFVAVSSVIHGAPRFCNRSSVSLYCRYIVIITIRLRLCIR